MWNRRRSIVIASPSASGLAASPLGPQQFGASGAPRAVVAAFAAVGLAAGACARVDPVPDLSGVVLATVDGEPFALASLAGQVSLLTFFATWCFPCIAEIPELVHLHTELRPRGFQVVAIGVDREGEAVLRAFRDFYRLPYPVLVADAEMREGRTPFGPVAALPTAFVVGRDGRVVFAYRGVAAPDGLRHALDEAVGAGGHRSPAASVP